MLHQLLQRQHHLLHPPRRGGQLATRQTGGQYTNLVKLKFASQLASSLERFLDENIPYGQSPAKLPVIRVIRVIHSSLFQNHYGLTNGHTTSGSIGMLRRQIFTKPG